MGIEKDMQELMKIFQEKAEEIMICSECGYKHKKVVQLKVCDKCGNDIDGYHKSTVLFMDMADRWVQLYMKHGVSEPQAQKRVIKLLETTSNIPTSIVRLIEVHFDDF